MHKRRMFARTNGGAGGGGVGPSGAGPRRTMRSLECVNLRHGRDSKTGVRLHAFVAFVAFVAVVAVQLAACGQADSAARVNVAGKHVHTLTVDGLAREVIVYVPELAAGTTPAPVVFMFHGTGGDGERFYQISGWKEKADAEGLIAVFPSALTYCLKEDENGDGDFDDPAETKVTTKWAAGELGNPAVMPLCSAAELALLSADQRALADHPLMDDVAYIDAILALLGDRYVVDATRVFASGFSNGASMTSRLALERSDRFAAIAAAAGSLTVPPAPAARPISLVFSVGHVDPRVTAVLGIPALPLDASLLTDVPEVKRVVVDPYLTVLQLADAYTYDERLIAGKKVVRFTWATSLVGATNTFELLVIEDLAHEYPNGRNHPLSIVDPLWQFFTGP